MAGFLDFPGPAARTAAHFDANKIRLYGAESVQNIGVSELTADQSAAGDLNAITVFTKPGPIVVVIVLNFVPALLLLTTAQRGTTVAEQGSSSQYVIWLHQP